ncbi:MAG: dipeptidase [Clostridia bacterium]|nr:dipeptidase [Clostridia bacterium]
MTNRVFPIADGHCDFLYGAMQYGYDIRTLKRDQTIHLPYMEGGNVALQCFAAWVDSTLKTPPLQQCMTMIERFYNMLDENPELVPFTGDFRPDSGKIAAILTIEGGEAMEGSLAMLRIYKRLGVRALTFTWNENNELAGAANARQSRGLTGLGKEMLAEMNRLGIALDVSHLSDAGIRDALKLSSRPIYASHSNARAIKNVPRCLPDELILGIAEQGGLIGVNFYPPQLCDGEAGVADVVRHIMHIVGIGGVDCCAFGSDFDGMQRYPRDIRNSLDYQKICRALVQAGFTEEQTERIAYWNLHRFFAQFI